MTVRIVVFSLLSLAIIVEVVHGQSVQTPNPSKAVYDRGSEALNRGDFEAAIANYASAIELDPKNARAYAGRGSAKRLKGDYVGALADLSKSIELDPAIQSSYYARAWVNLILSHGDAAYADATKLLSFNESNQMIFPTHVLIAYFGYRQARREAEADAYLKSAGLKLYSGSWTTQIVRYLRHEVSDAQLITSANGKKATVEARTYVGLDQSLSGRKEAALVNLRWVIANADKRMFEYALASAEIGRLELPVTNKN
jgi:tetratricopeptide (TPR) repeat protein